MAMVETQFTHTHRDVQQVGPEVAAGVGECNNTIAEMTTMTKMFYYKSTGPGKEDRIRGPNTVKWKPFTAKASYRRTGVQA